MSEREHFDGVLKHDKRSPAAFKEVDGVNTVLIEPNTGKLVITGKPNDLHNCDRRGCGSIEHKIAEFEIDREILEPVRNLTETNNP